MTESERPLTGWISTHSCGIRLPRLKGTHGYAFVWQHGRQWYATGRSGMMAGAILQHRLQE